LVILDETIKLAAETHHVYSALVSIEFALKQYCNDLDGREKFSRRFVGVVIRSNCVPLFAKLGPELYVHVTAKHAEEVCTLGHTDILRHLVHSGLVDFNTINPKPSLPGHSLMEIAILHGHRDTVSYFFEIGANRSLQKVLVYVLYNTPGPVFLMVQHLLDSGILLDDSMSMYIDHLAKLCVEGSEAKVQRTEHVMTVLLIVSQLKKRNLLEVEFGMGNLKDMTEKIIKGKIQVPYAPLDFAKAAREIHTWLQLMGRSLLRRQLQAVH
jgi:hypothetical protein